MNFVHVSTTTQNDELASFKFQNSNPNQYAILLPRSQIFILLIPENMVNFEYVISVDVKIPFHLYVKLKCPVQWLLL